MSEIIDISPGNLDSSLCFIQSSISLAYKLNKQGDNIQVITRLLGFEEYNLSLKGLSVSLSLHC